MAALADIEKLVSVRLRPEEQEELLATATECSFIFSVDGGWPTGVIMSFLYDGGSFWVTAAADRRQVRSLAADPRVSIIVSGIGTELGGRQMFSTRGVAIVHSDAETRHWFLPRFVGKLAPVDQAAFIRLLDSDNRVVIEVRPVGKPVTHDSRKMPGDGRGGPAA
ncbi:MAG: hypothetical protein JWM76_4282 [Pseudonocardiales bacterium]|nr:hypothetical protein [Pseudonocardiales bacterium]